MTNELDMKNEPTFPEGAKPIEVGKDAPDFSLTMVNGLQIRFMDLVKKTPVLVNFIKGTWCPFCQAHMMNLKKWRGTILDTQITILVLSNEDLPSIRAWVRDNPLTYLMGRPDDPAAVFKAYGLNMDHHDFARPATFLVDGTRKIRMSYIGIRDERLEKEVIQASK